MSDSDSASLPEKAFYKIAEVARLVGVKPYVLRYWESEFRLARPQKTQSGQRLYHRRDIETLRLIRRMLYEDKVTIPNAKKQLRQTLHPSGEKLAAQPQLPLGFSGASPVEGAIATPEVPSSPAPASGEGGVGHELSPVPLAPAVAPSDEARVAMGSGAPPLEDAPPAQSLDTRLRHVLLRDPTSRALVDQALREAQAILALAAGSPPVR